MSNQKLNRRDFIRLSALATASLPISLSGFPVFAQQKPNAFNLKTDNENVLVLVQLQGGNDGLNSLFDLNQYSNLYNVRSNIIVPQNQLLSLNAANSLHPSLLGFQKLWQQEKLSIVQNVAYPDQNRSHFRSSDIWHSASDANVYEASGWLGRFFDLSNPNYPEGYPDATNPHPFAITIGKIVSETCQGTSVNFSMALTDPENPGTANVFNAGSVPNNCYGDALHFVNETVKQTNAYAAVIAEAASKGANLSTKYPSTELAEKLKNVAKLIAGGLQTKVFVVQIGGFDTHDNQVVTNETQTGVHANLLKQVADAIEAFQDDIDLLNVSHKVMGMTYSEFGRRIKSNAALGTDHGTAAPMFFFGNCVNNQIIGDNPEIDTQVDDDEGVQMQFDFRNIYSTILTDWLGATKQESNIILFENFDALPLFKNGCNASLSTDTNLLDFRDINIHPNPASTFFNIRFFGTNEPTKITLYNSIGAVVKEITNKTYSLIQYSIKVDIESLPSGNYFVHYQTRGISKTKKLMKY